MKHAWITSITLSLIGAGILYPQSSNNLSGLSTKISKEQQSNLAQTGQKLFQDTTLSNPVGQGCITCHLPQHAFADPRPLSPGAMNGRLGTRNTPTLMYAALIPNFQQEDLPQPDGSVEWVWEGGLFHDGRARTLHDQVQLPFFDHAEMNLADTKELASKLRKSEHAKQLRSFISEDDWNNDEIVIHWAYRSLVEFLKEPMFRPFNARIDTYLKGDTNVLSPLEKTGLDVFKNKGKCADCHFLTPVAWPAALLSDYGYDNLGVPSRGKKDPGLASHTKNAAHLGQFRAPTLRNITLTAPYMHNGSIATLREVMEFYNSRDLEPDRWGPTDYPETVNHEDLGNLKLTDQEITALVAFMDTLTDQSILDMRAQKNTLPEAPTTIPDSWSMRAYFPDWTHANPPLPPVKE